ncbi:MAG: LysE family translocator [Hyphomonadaceae bacterium]|nr:LysE family translocator [Hyphomonadaceae bacterium]
MTTDLILALAAYAFVSSITPGPNNLMLMASGTNFGFTRTLPHMLGVALGFAVMILLVGAGLVQLFDAVPASYLVLKVVSCAYLVYLAWKIATAAPPASKAAPGGGSKPFTFLQAALFQWVNPKAWTMALTAVTAFSLPMDPVASLIVIALVFGGINLPSVGAWALMGAQLRRFLEDPVKLRVFNVTAALTLLATLYPVLAGRPGS